MHTKDSRWVYNCSTKQCKLTYQLKCRHIFIMFLSMLLTHQELEELRRREVAEREAMERWKEEERRKFQQEIEELRRLFLQEFKGIANKSYSLEAVSVHN